MKTNIIVCIPTFKRTRFLVDLLSSLNEAFTWCQERLHDDAVDLRFVVSDNDPYSEARDAIEEKLPRTKERLTYRVNASNIGIERNILKVIELGVLMYGQSQHTYIWAIGDDDLVSVNSIYDIYRSIVNAGSKRPGLIVCAEHPCNDRLREITGTYNNYGDAIKRFDEVYPQRPIHHTLMSLNVFRSDIYDSTLACDSLGTLYAQMYGLIHSRKFIDETVVCLDGYQIILRTDTEGFHDRGLYREVPFRWAEYYTKTRMLHLPYRAGHVLKEALRSDYWRE
jgi:hypothetical protein